MSILNLVGRDIIRFNVTDAKHRGYVNEFLTTRSWAKCPVVFYLEPEYASLSEMVSVKMLQFYMSNDKEIVASTPKVKRKYNRKPKVVQVVDETVVLEGV